MLLSVERRGLLSFRPRADRGGGEWGVFFAVAVDRRHPVVPARLSPLSLGNGDRIESRRGAPYSRFVSLDIDTNNLSRIKLDKAFLLYYRLVPPYGAPFPRANRPRDFRE